MDNRAGYRSGSGEKRSNLFSTLSESKVSTPPVPLHAWPQNKRFAFTIVDDTDEATVKNAKPVYDFLLRQGFLITKTVWPLAPTARPRTGGDTLEDPDYLAWVLDLQSRGIEIAYHGATDHSSTRDRTLESLNRFKANFGCDPYVYTEHTGQREAMYWGAARLEGLPRVIYQGLNALGGRERG